MKGMPNVDDKLAFWLAQCSDQPLAIVIRGQLKVRMEKNTVRYLTNKSQSEVRATKVIEDLEASGHRFVFLSAKSSHDLFGFTLDAKNPTLDINLELIQKRIDLKRNSFSVTFEFLEDFELKLSTILSTVADLQSQSGLAVGIVSCYNFSSEMNFRIPVHLVVSLEERTQNSVIGLQVAVSLDP
jgi:hypothetical protein